MSAVTGSRLPRGVVLEGAVRGQGDLRVGGEIVGPVEIEGHLVIEGSGVVRGEVRARAITIAGTLEGHATAAELLRLEAGARMTGDARAERVSAAQGALLKGRVRTSQERAQLERMRRTTGGTLLAPFSSSGHLAAPPLEPTGDAALIAPPVIPSVGERSPAIDRLAEAAVARVTRDAVIDARDPAVLVAHATQHAIVGKAAAERRSAAEPPRRVEMDRPPAPIMPAIGRRRARRRDPELGS